MTDNETNTADMHSYYRDAYITAFDARVVERIPLGDRLGVVLNHSYFYPTSGGQPNDTGTMNGVKVIDVSLREEDDSILHVLESEIKVDRVQCEIDWCRRFDHMQQHSGQHILSAAFEQLLDADTIGFHLGSDSSTIDLNIDGLTVEELAAVEEMANDVVVSNRPVTAMIMSPDRVRDMALRKPPAVSGPVRIVSIQDFDLSACGGTHVKQAGEIGVIKITRLESRGSELRVEFLCGRRALVDYRAKNALIMRIANSFTTSYHEIESAVDRLREETRTLRSELRRIRTQLLDYEADDLYDRAEQYADLRVVQAAFVDRDREDLSWLARNLAERPNVVVLFGLAGAKCHLLFSRAPNVDRDMVPLLKSALAVLNSTAGGGRPQIAQGGGPAADKARVNQALSVARELLLA
jgi:alanyl-tRNA synthetase